MAFLIASCISALCHTPLSLFFPLPDSNSDSCISLYSSFFSCQIFYSFTDSNPIQNQIPKRSILYAALLNDPLSPLPFTQNSAGSWMFSILAMTRLAPSVSKNMPAVQGSREMATSQVNYIYMAQYNKFASGRFTFCEHPVSITELIHFVFPSKLIRGVPFRMFKTQKLFN